jgi:hypothetical protein
MPHGECPAGLRNPIDFGAHPNEGVLASMRREETKDAVTFQVGILHPDPLLMTVTLKALLM